MLSCTANAPPVFETAIAYPMIFVAAKKVPADDHTPVLAEPPTLESPYPEINAVVGKYGQPLPPNALARDGNWRLTSSAISERRFRARLGLPVPARVRGLASGFGPVWVTRPDARSLVVVPFCLCFFGPGIAPRALVSPMRFRLLLRSVVIVIAWAFYYTAARYLQLAELVTIYFSSPLLVAVLAPLILKEQVPWSRWASVGIGFLGVIIACRPTHLHQPVPILLALTAARLPTRRREPGEEKDTCSKDYPDSHATRFTVGVG